MPKRITQVLRALGIEFAGPQTERYLLKSDSGPEIQIISNVEELFPGNKSRTVTIDITNDFNGHKISCPQIRYELTELGNPDDMGYQIFEFPITYRHDVNKIFYQVRAYFDGSSKANVPLHNEIMRQLIALGKQLLNKDYRLVRSETIA